MQEYYASFARALWHPSGMDAMPLDAWVGGWVGMCVKKPTIVGQIARRFSSSRRAGWLLGDLPGWLLRVLFACILAHSWATSFPYVQERGRLGELSYGTCLKGYDNMRFDLRSSLIVILAMVALVNMVAFELHHAGILSNFARREQPVAPPSQQNHPPHSSSSSSSSLSPSVQSPLPPSPPPPPPSPPNAVEDKNADADVDPGGAVQSDEKEDGVSRKGVEKRAEQRREGKRKRRRRQRRSDEDGDGDGDEDGDEEDAVGKEDDDAGEKKRGVRQGGREHRREKGEARRNPVVMLMSEGRSGSTVAGALLLEHHPYCAQYLDELVWLVFRQHLASSEDSDRDVAIDYMLNSTQCSLSKKLWGDADTVGSWWVSQNLPRFHRL